MRSETDLSAILQRSPYVRFLGARVELRGDELTVVLPYAETVVGNPMTPALHGGAIGALMETAATAQLFTQLDLQKFPKPVDVAVDYLRIGRAKDTYARAIVTRHGSRVAHVRAEAWQDARSEPIATLHGHFLIARQDAA